MPLKVRIEQENPQKIYLEGTIDESVNLNETFERFTGNIVLDLSGIHNINSMGINKWIPLISKYSDKHQVEVEKLSYALVIQSNLIMRLFGSAKIVSCNAPYFCHRCKKDYLVEITREELEKSKFEAPKLMCSQCSSEMTFDDLPSYFDFFNSL